jgi:hypothetical protein
MGLQTHVIGFTERDLKPADVLLRETAAAFGATHTGDVKRTIGKDRGWADRFHRWKPMLRLGVAVISVPAQKEMEHLGFKRSIDEAVGLIRPGISLYAALRNPGWPELDAAIREQLPESIRGQCVPSGMIVRVGWHDLYHGDYVNPKLFGRAWYSLTLMGHDTPADGPAFREHIFRVPAIRRVFEIAAGVAGPLSHCVY